MFGQNAFWLTVRLFATHKFSRVNHHVANSTCSSSLLVSLLWSTQRTCLNCLQPITPWLCKRYIIKTLLAKSGCNQSARKVCAKVLIASQLKQKRRMNCVKNFLLLEKASPQFYSCACLLPFILRKFLRFPLRVGRYSLPSNFTKNMEFRRSWILGGFKHWRTIGMHDKNNVSNVKVDGKEVSTIYFVKYEVATIGGWGNSCILGKKRRILLK